MNRQNKYHTHVKPVIGIEITNNTPEVQNLTFLGMYHRHKCNRMLKLRNIISDTLYDDHDLAMLNDWILSVGNICVNAIYFTTSLSYGMFDNKVFTVKVKDISGCENIAKFSLSNFFDVRQYRANYIRIDRQFILDFWTELSQTHIEPGEIFQIYFNLNTERYSDKFEKLIKESDQLFNKDQKRKLLLLM